MKNAKNPYGDGRSADKIIKAVLNFIIQAN